MTTIIEANKLTKGTSFLLENPNIGIIFTPEDFTEEQKMIARTTGDFIRRDVLPRIEEMEHGHQEINIELLRKAAAIGLLGIEIEEQYGGLALDKASSTLVAEHIGASASFATTFGAHTGIGTLPIAYFGTEAQKKKYLPQLVAAQLISAYALTEAESGSDALAAKTTAVLSPDGQEYILNGSKMWITNAGFAGIFVVFAKVNGKDFSAFIVEKEFSGVSVGAEEKKMGIKASSTRQVHLENACVPSENLLGEIGKGHRIALNILNMGRLKLAASCIGGAKVILREAVQYANQRHQFGKPIASFGAIQHKLARMATYTWVGESMLYRTAGLIDQALSQSHDLPRADNSISDHDRETVGISSRAKLRAIEEYSVECSILKVRCSEYLDFAADEAVQIFGGNGYSQEYPVERFYRDSRINRIFDGTNEINRLLIPAMIIRRALKGELPFLAATKSLQEEILSSEWTPVPPGPFAGEYALIAAMKKSALFLGGLAMQNFGDKLTEQQEVLILFSDIVMETYAAESAIVRAQQSEGKVNQQTATAFTDMAHSYLYEAAQLVEAKAGEALPALAGGDMLHTYLSVLKKLFRHEPINQIEIRRRIVHWVFGSTVQ